MRESTIHPSKVKKIMEKLGIPIEIDPFGCYFLVWDEGREYIVEYEHDDPIAENRTSQSWI